MYRPTSYASSGASNERKLSMNEQFQTFPATLGSTSETRLQQQHRRRLVVRDSATVISTAISTSGWLATVTSSEVRLYCFENQDPAREIRQSAQMSIKMQSKNEKIRSVAISDDLLAVVTHCRLLVYEYKGSNKLEENRLEAVPIDQNGTWTPKSVSILQVDSNDTRQSAAAYIAIGGEGVNGVKLFEYSRVQCWNAHRARSILKCPKNNGLVRTTGFSQFLRMNNFLVFAVTSDNRIYCWYVGLRQSGSLTTISAWELDCNFRQDRSPPRGEITSVAIFDSPSGRPYLFCTVDQSHGSHLLRSFIVPLEFAANDPGPRAPQWRPLPDSVAGRNVLSGRVSSNGYFLVTVEEGVMRLLTLRGAYEGGLTCLEQTLEWHSPLRSIAKDISGLSLSMKEHRGGLEITAVDGHGRVVFARVSVPGGMPVTPRPCLVQSRGRESISELSNDLIIRELYAGSPRRSSISSA